MRSIVLCAFMLSLAACASQPKEHCEAACQLARRYQANDPEYQAHQRELEAQAQENRAEHRREFFQNLSASLHDAQVQQHAQYCAQLRNNRTATTNTNCTGGNGSAYCTGTTTLSPLPADCQ